MEMEAVRDLIIVIYGVVGIVALCIVLALLIVLYRKATSILDTAKDAVENVRSTSSAISESVIQPIAKAQGFVAGMKKAMDIISSLSKKGEAEKDGK